MKLNRYAIFSWSTLAYVLFVIVWGAYVRATGSGAGCGSHWPLCNGEVVPRAPEVETMIEFTHRVTSGISLLLVVGMVVWARRAYPRGHLVRRGAAASLVLMIVEALLGAGLVVFGLVAEDDSVARAISMALHLVNTFLLVGAITLTCWWASGGAAPRLRGQGVALSLLAVGIIGFVILGMSGAVTALGDTLFKAIRMSEARALGITHWLLPLRIFHPLIAIVVGSYLILAAGFVALRRAGAGHPPARRRADHVDPGPARGGLPERLPAGTGLAPGRASAPGGPGLDRAGPLLHLGALGRAGAGPRREGSPAGPLASRFSQQVWLAGFQSKDGSGRQLCRPLPSLSSALVVFSSGAGGGRTTVGASPPWSHPRAA